MDNNIMSIVFQDIYKHKKKMKNNVSHFIDLEHKIKTELDRLYINRLTPQEVEQEYLKKILKSYFIYGKQQ